MRAIMTVLAAALIAAPAQAQRPQQQYLDAIRIQLERMGGHALQRGYAPAGGLTYGTLNAGARETRPLSLQAGVAYAILGACDQDCSDMDLRLLAPDSVLVTQDVEVDDRPVLEFTVPRSGVYLVMVMMPGCRQSPCYWGFQLYQRR
jgi:hypothetical protein